MVAPWSKNICIKKHQSTGKCNHRNNKKEQKEAENEARKDLRAGSKTGTATKTIYILAGEIPRQKEMAPMQNNLTKSSALCCCLSESQGRGQRSDSRGVMGYIHKEYSLKPVNNFFIYRIYQNMKNPRL